MSLKPWQLKNARPPYSPQKIRWARRYLRFALRTQAAGNPQPARAALAAEIATWAAFNQHLLK